MKRCNLKHLILSLILGFIPMLLGVYIFNKLPINIPIIFNRNSENIFYLSNIFIVFILPLTFIFVNILVYLYLNRNVKRKQMDKNIKILMVYLVPGISNLLYLLFYLSIYNIKVTEVELFRYLLGTVFILLGIFLNKNNNSLKYILLWNVNNDSIWEQTNFIIKIMFIAGGLSLVTINYLYKENHYYYIALITTIFLPAIYSYLLYKFKK